MKPMNTYSDEIKGIIGMVLSIGVPSITMIEGSIRLIAGIAGLLLLFYSIRHKIIQTSVLKLEKQKLQDELKE